MNEPLRVGIGIHACQNLLNWERGIPRYTRDLTMALLANHSDVVKEVWIDNHLPPPKRLADFCGAGVLRAPSADRRSRRSRQPVDVYHIMSPFEEVFSPLRTFYPPEVAGARLVVTLYDLIPMKWPERYLPSDKLREKYTARQRLIREADLIIAISETTARDAQEVLGIPKEKFQVVYVGVSDQFSPPIAPPDVVLRQVQAALPRIQNPYVFYTGAIDYRKNLEAAIIAFSLLPSQLRSRYQFVITCKATSGEVDALMNVATQRGVEDRVVVTGFVADDVLKLLYQGSTLVIYPSLYEGFGLPIVEAMRSGAPVITSDRASMREIVELPEARFDPEDPAAISRTLEAVLGQPTLAEKLRTYGSRRWTDFQWSRIAQQTVDAYQSLVPVKTRSFNVSRPRRMRLALVTPFPPQASGIADYSQRFVQRLVAEYPVEVDIIVDGKPPGDEASKSDRVMVIGAAPFRWSFRHHEYDYVVYCMGNSAYHGYAFELLRRHRGAVWLHDVRLTGLYRWYLEEHPKDPALSRLLDTWAPHFRARDRSFVNLPVATQHEDSIYLAGLVGHSADRIFVNSQFAHDLLVAELGQTVPMTQLPFASEWVSEEQLDPAARASFLASHGLSPNAKVIVSTGMLAPIKDPERMIAAFAVVSRQVPGAHLVFVGEYDPPYRAKLAALVADDISANVHFTGRVPREELHRWLSWADCAVQLRFPTNGESSAAVASCLAYGLPTIVTADGPQREFQPAVSALSVDVTAEALGREIIRLTTDPVSRAAAQRAAFRHAETNTFAHVVEAFWHQMNADLAQISL